MPTQMTASDSPTDTSTTPVAKKTTGVLSSIDKTIKDKNVKVIANILKLDISKAEAIVSAMFTLYNAYDETQDTAEESTEGLANESPSSEPSTGGMNSSSAYSL